MKNIKAYFNTAIRSYGNKFLILFICLWTSMSFAAQITIDDIINNDTPKKNMIDIDANFTELYGKWTSLGTTHDTSGKLDALYEAELDNEAGLYAALSDIDDFVQTTEIDTLAELEGVSNGGAYMSDLLAAISEANFKSIVNLEVGTDVQAYDADLTTWGAITPSANVQSLNSAATFQAFLDLLFSSDYTPTGAVDLTGASSVDLGPINAGEGVVELPNSAAPTTDATGEIALDTTITDHQPLFQYYDGAENMTVIAIDTAELPALDNEIIKYNAATDKFVLEADATGSPGAYEAGIEADFYGTVINPQGVYDATTAHHVTFAVNVPAAFTITAIYISCDADPTTEPTLTFQHKAAGVGYGSPTTIEAVTTTAGVASITSGIDDATIPADTKLFFTLSDPDNALEEIAWQIKGDWD